jgi:SAM-dependent methyltransferase
MQPWECPCCTFTGPFMPEGDAVMRKHAICPSCLSAERHRLQRLVCDKVFADFSCETKTCLQFASDSMTPYLKKRFAKVVTADIDYRPGSVKLDMRAIEMKDGTFDCVYASHVLEHIQEDGVAIREAHRVLKPGGMAILPVPIMCDSTVEYGRPMPNEFYHVRAPGLDYYDRYKPVFDRVEILTSNDFDPKYQIYVHEDRTVFPSALAPYRTGMEGGRHIDAVPVCHKA